MLLAFQNMVLALRKICFSFILLLLCLRSFSQTPDSWTQRADMPAGAAARDRAISFVINGKGYIGLGSDGVSAFYKTLWEYEPITNVWIQKADFTLSANSNRNRSFSFSVNGKGYFGTGWDGTAYLIGVFEYDPVLNVWSQKNNFPGGQRYGASAFVIGQKAYAMGGFNGASVFNDLWEYNYTTDTWTAKASLPLGRYSGIAFTIGGKGYYGSGYNAGYLDDCWRYDPISNNWTQVADIPGGPRALAAAFSFGQRGFVAGGSDATSFPRSDVWEYNIFTNTWIPRNPLPFGGRFGASTFVIGNSAFLGCGNSSTSGTMPQKDLWQYTPTIFTSNKFQKSYGGTGFDTDTAYMAYANPTNDGGYILSSSTKSFGNGGNDLYLLKVTPAGAVQWSKTYGSTANEIASSVRPTSDGGYIVAGQTRKSVTDADMLVVKIDNSSALQWNRSVGGTQLSRANYAEEIKAGGEYLVVGKGELVGGNNTCLLRLNNTGAASLRQNITVTSSVDEGFSIAQTVSGNYVISGNMMSGATDIDAYLVALNNLGNIIAGGQARFDSPGLNGWDVRSQVRQTADGGFIICGSSNVPGFTHGLYDFFLLKVQSNFAVSWAKVYGGAQDDFARSIAITNDGNFAVAGYTNSFGTGTDAFLSLLDANGSTLWTKTYGGSLADRVNSVYPTADGGFILCGETFSFANPTTASDIYLIKTDSLGNSGCNEATVSLSPANSLTFTLIPASGTPQLMTTNSVLITPMSSSGSVSPLCSQCTFPIIKTKSNISCFGSNTGAAAVSPSGGNAPYTYTWSTGATTSSVSGLAAGTYTVTAIDGNMCSVTDTIKIIQAPATNITLLDDSVAICAGGSDTIGANATGGTAPLTYVWSPASGLSCTSCQNAIASPTVSTPFFITVVDSNSCTKKDTVYVTVLPALSVNAGNDNTICAGNSTTIGSAPVAGVSYVWTPGTALSNTSIANPIANPAVTTTYVVTATNAGGCSISDNVVVYVVASPTVNIVPSGSTTLCKGTSLTLAVSTNATNYLWSTGSTTSTIGITPSATSSYSVAAVIGSCYASSSIQITVVPTPTASISSSNSTVCTGTSVLLTGSGVGNYLWSTGSTATAITVSSTATGTFTYSLTVTAPGNASCSDSDSYALTFFSSPAISISSTYTTICAGFSTDTLSATGGGNYYWLPGGQTTSSIVVSPDNPTTYTVIVSNGSGCTGTSTFLLNVIAGFNPPAVSSQNFSYCLGDVIQPITATSTPPAIIGWADVAGNTLGLGNSYQPPQSLGIGTYTILCVQGTGVQCLSYSTPVTLSIHALPVASAGSDVTICPGSTAQLQASGGTSYLWSPTTYLNSPLVANPSSNPDSSVMYTVIVTDANNCKDYDSVAVFVDFNDSCGIHIYNVLTPNGDGNNDVWWIDGISAYPENSVTIFNRWGSRVWGGKNYDNKKVVWKGQNEQNEPLPTGTYYYTITIKGRTYSKWVELIR